MVSDAGYCFKDWQERQLLSHHPPNQTSFAWGNEQMKMGSE